MISRKLRAGVFGYRHDNESVEKTCSYRFPFSLQFLSVAAQLCDYLSGQVFGDDLVLTRVVVQLI